MQPAAGSASPGGDGDRHPAVIAFADVVGYSRLVADDEPGTLNRWTANVLKPEAERRRGQVGDLRGDGPTWGYLIAALVNSGRLADLAI